MAISNYKLKEYQMSKSKGYKEVTKKNFKFKPNNQSADYIMPSFAVGCPVAKCSYCYVARHREFGNPLYEDTDLNLYVEKCADFYDTLPAKYPTYSNQQDEWKWVLEIGESTDLLSPNLIESTNFLMRSIVIQSGFMTSFATKLATPQVIEKLDNSVWHFRNRIRVSLMPQVLSDVLEPGTAKIKDRIASIRELYKKDFQVHINFSPIVMYGGDQWMKDYIDLCKLVDQELGADYIGHKVRQQLACEIIFLTHHERLHSHNLRWNPEAEKLLWTPNIQEYKTNNRGNSDILRYRRDLKAQGVKIMKAIIKKHMPYCNVRYAF